MGVYHIVQMLYLLDMPKVERVSEKGYREMGRRTTGAGSGVRCGGFGFVKFADGVTMDICEAWSVHLGSFEGCSIIGNRGGIRMTGYSDQAALTPFSYHTTVCDLDLNCTVNLNEMDIRWQQLR